MSAVNEKIAAALLCCAVALASCGGGGGGDSAAPAPAPAAPARVVTQSDAQIATLLYSDSQRTPSGFYADPIPSGVSYAATLHLKNTDLSGAPQQHELCTDDWNEALGWSEVAADNAANYSDLVATETTARYYEFGRVPRGQTGGYLRARVYRCTYLDRDTVDLQGESPAAGRLNRRPLTGADLRELSEYLWLFTRYNNFGHVVLRSTGLATAAGFEHTLYLASLQRSAQAPSCDRILVHSWRHLLDTATGDLQLQQQPLWEFGAREMSGAIELCAAP
ncbi:MAG: hypothetical protein HC872_07645 [Gammaproteobacteria bacterium]|nr:hypothetical protein [Gammaproteobacteria bacterium]